MKIIKLTLVATSIFLASCSGRIEEEITDPISKKVREKYEYIETDDGSRKKDGYYKQWYSNGQIKVSGNFLLNKKDGEWKMFYKDGTLERHAFYSADSLNGKQLRFYPNGNKKSESNYVMNKMDGEYKRWHENGNLESEETLVNGEREGVVSTFFENGAKFTQGDYNNGKLVGTYSVWYENGKPSEVSNYENGELSGAHKKFFKNGNIQIEGDYSEGLKSGTWKTHFEDGNIFTETFEKGINTTLVGKWRINDSYTIEYFKDGSALHTEANGKESKNRYKMMDGKIKYGYDYFNFSELSPTKYVIEKRGFRGVDRWEAVKI